MPGKPPTKSSLGNEKHKKGVGTSTEREINKGIYAYVALVALFALTATYGWHGNRTLHTMMQVIATLCALGVGVLALVKTTGQPTL